MLSHSGNNDPSRKLPRIDPGTRGASRVQDETSRFCPRYGARICPSCTE